MTSQSLYRKWRSRTFEDLLGQDHVVQTLRNAVKNDRIAHAYLFTGPRGTGKTSMARVMAKAVNCLNPRDGGPCGDCYMCIAIGEGRSPDVIEVDAASSGQVDDIRSLRERVGYAPAEATFKVYIIDEVHRLGPGAFEALLKTVEEPPPHVLFVFASTEPHKIPMTILSRCQRFDFHKIDRQTSVARIGDVANQEGLTLDEEAVILISHQAGGSLRDALGILDQVRAFAGDTITADDVRNGIGLGRPEVVARISEAIVDNDPGAALTLISEASRQGIDPRTLSRQLIEYWREVLLHVSGAGNSDNLDPLLIEAAKELVPRLTGRRVIAVLKALTEQVIEPRLSVASELPLEIGVAQAVVALHNSDSQPVGSTMPPAVQAGADHKVVREGPVTTSSDSQPAEPAIAVSEEAAGAAPFVEVHVEAESTAVSVIPAEQEQSPVASSEASESTQTIDEAWATVIDRVGTRSKSLQGLLRDVAQRQVAGTELTLGFRWAFHRTQSDKPENRAMIEKTIEDVVGTRFKVRCVTVDPSSVPPPVDDDEAFIAEAGKRLRAVHAQQFRTGGRPDS